MSMMAAPEMTGGPDLNPYTTQVSAASNHTERLVGHITALALGLGGVRSVAGGAAAEFQHMATGMSAAATVTGQSTAQLSGSVRQLQRDFPLATREALATVQAVQSLGLTAKGQEGQVARLSNEMVKLAGATGTMDKAQLAQSFGTLNREMASLDPDRVRRFGDSLTTLSARSGASAQGIVNFAQSISPFAQAAGAGETAVLGISTAFTKLGNDGYVAANTVNTMFSDLTRSVREGSNQMSGYANILGMTNQQFERMYKSNPAGTIAAVTQRIGTAGPAGTRMLESIGIEGIRGQRALLLAAQSGGLPAAIRQAERAYGSGSTATASATAYSNVSDSLTRLQNSATSVAEAFERPLLHSVGRIIDATAAIPRAVGGAVGNHWTQDVLGVTGQIAGPLIVARLIMKALGIGATTMFLGGSGPVRGFLGGINRGAVGGPAEAMESHGFLARMGRPFYAAEASGADYGGRFMRGINERAYLSGMTLGSFMGEGSGGPGLLGMGARYGVSGLGMALKYHSEIARLAGTSALERDTMKTAGFSSPMQGLAARHMDIMDEHRSGLITSAERNEKWMASLKLFNEELKNTGLASLTASEALKGSGSLLKNYGSMAATATMGMMGGLLKAVAPMAIIGGGIAAYQGYRHSQEAQKAEVSRLAGMDMFGAVDKYRDALGQAGEAATNLANQFNSAAAIVSKTEGSRFSTARTVSQQDIAATGTTVGYGNKAIKNPFMGSSSDQVIAQQISAMNLSGMTPSDLQAVKMDLLKQGFSEQRVDNILSKVSVHGTGTFTKGEISGSVSAIVHAAQTYSPSAAEAVRRADDHWREGGGRIGDSPLVGNEGKEFLDRMQQGIKQQYQNLTSHYGQGYAVNRELATARQALRQAVASGNPDAVAAIGQRFSQELTGKRQNFTAGNIRAAGGDLGQILADRGIKIQGHTLAYWQQQGQEQRRVQQSGDYEALRGAGANMFMPFYDAKTAPATFADRQARQLALRAGQRPDDQTAQTKAVNALVDGAMRAGHSLAEVAHQAVKSGAAFEENSQQQQVFARALAEVQFRLSTQLIGANRATTFQANTQLGLSLANTNGNSQWAQQQRQQGREQLQQTYASEVQWMQERLQAQMQYQIQSSRAQHDYQLQVSRSEQDYLLGRQRAYQDFNIQMQREREDAAKTLYDPYTRIQAMPVWDAVNLADNSQTQIQAMRQQISNLNKLRALGMDDATIQMLGLYSPDKAQEVSQLVGDLQNHPRELATLNRQTAVRTRLAGQLISQDPQYKRQREDFNRQMDRQQSDFQRQMDRAHTDFMTSQERMAQDLHTQDLEMTNDLKSLQKGMNDILHGNLVDFTHIAENTMARGLRIINRYAPKYKHALDGASTPSGGAPGATGDSGVTASGSQKGGGFGDAPVGGTTSGGENTFAPHNGHQTRAGTTGSAGSKYVAAGSGSIYGGPERGGTTSGTHDYDPSNKFMRQHVADPKWNQSIARKMKPAWGSGQKWSDWLTLWNNESGWNQYADNPGSDAYGIPQAVPGSKMASSGADWRTNPATQILWGIGHINAYGDPSKALAFWNRTDPRSMPGAPANAPKYGGHWYADGGIATTPHIGVMAELGNEAVIPLNTSGVAFLARALREYMTHDDAVMITGGGGRAYSVHIDHSTHHYDNRVDFRGSEVKVESSDPDEMARKLEQRARTANLTRARGVTWR